ncbi:hypothetical protein A9507_11665 [Methanobacterium sp. A39]|uniref:Glycosyl hydrolase n=2 Tax=Methanobacteriaceae TaxID=2159 RepID=A0A2A2H3P4_METBR|nr:hypothetical protein A9507_11665 [Methanobacterium sp. A39]PAV03910.1 hypothetical protein ASJ80_02505 [Methanobacterium bryantii]
MYLKIQEKIPNFVIQHMDGEEILASSNYTIFRSRNGGHTFKRIISLPVPFYSRFMGECTLFSRALRLGIKTIIKLANGTILAVASKQIFHIKDGEVSIVHTFYKGFGPLRKGWCEDGNGNCYFGEYFLNNKRDSKIRLFKSTDDGRFWNVICSLNNIRHIHSVQFDPYSKNVWLCTGDKDSESKIMFSEDGGETWTNIASGSQMFRTLSLTFTKKHIYWGTDIPTRQNYICRYVRGDGSIEKLTQVDGPVHYSTTAGDKFKVFATTVEGNSEGISSQWDENAHIWASKDGINWHDIISWKKDLWPYVLGYGRVIFPNGENKTNDLYFTTQALQSFGNTLIKARICT